MIIVVGGKVVPDLFKNENENKNEFFFGHNNMTKMLNEGE